MTRMKGHAMLRLPLIALLLALANPAAAQTAPSVREVAAYDGLFLAARQGDVAAIDRLIAAGADVNARDPMGRTRPMSPPSPRRTKRCARWLSPAPI